MEIINQLSGVISILTLIILGIGVYLGLKRLNIMQKQYYDNFEWEKRLNSTKYSLLYHPLMRESKQILQEEFNLYGRKDSIPKQDFLDAIESDSKIQIHLNNILTYYENICLACIKKVADEKIIFDMCGKTMANIRNKLINYIDYHREISGNERLWKEFVNFSKVIESKYLDTSAKELDEIGKTE